MGGSKIHVLMFPWFAFGHMTPFLHLANKLAEKGHKVTYLLPKKAQEQLENLNLHPESISFNLVSVPSVNDLPAGAETASDIPISLSSSLASAMDLTRDQVEARVHALKPDLIFYDFAHWIPEIAQRIGVKTVCYVTVSAATVAISLVPGLISSRDGPKTEDELVIPPPGYPSSKVVFYRHEARTLLFLSLPFGDGTTFYERVIMALTKCDAICLRTYKELERKFCEYIESQYQKKVLLTGPMLPDPDKTKPLEDRWSNWLSVFEPGSVVFCALGSQIILEKDQFQELCLGLELTGLPFLAVLKPPNGTSAIQEAFPKGFEERVKDRGVIYGGWIQQPLILSHPSVGCFVSHCGFGSMWESLMSDSQIVLIPHLGDQILNTRLMAEELKVAVEVHRDKTGWFSKESLSHAIASVVDKDSETGTFLRKNRQMLKETLVSPGLTSCYVDNFVEELQNLVHTNSS
ncbi:PREDICTED: UDP-glycosyltransferase 79B6-like [Tarenaya hassleriana]|uniref:UDP-glycosyltransferase 79B6-like n=1 Tax=Tarenaya hassleriana TaxID=28532 RepID=UPI00053C6032|nr:PREDICTED: UDP-glycosyltransferase 79B6-like [Tarenaya hassleriana]